MHSHRMGMREYIVRRERLTGFLQGTGARDRSRDDRARTESCKVLSENK